MFISAILIASPLFVSAAAASAVPVDAGPFPFADCYRNAPPPRAVAADRHLDLSSCTVPRVITGLVPPSYALEGVLDAVAEGLGAGTDFPATVAVDVSPLGADEAPLKFPGNGTLVSPGRASVRRSDLLRLLARGPAARGYHAYARMLPLAGGNRLMENLPLKRLLHLASSGGAASGGSVLSANLWLGDGGLRSAPHYDSHDNLLLQLAGTKRVLLVPPNRLAKPTNSGDGYGMYEEVRFQVEAAAGGPGGEDDVAVTIGGAAAGRIAFFGGPPVPTGRFVENHAGLNAFRPVPPPSAEVPETKDGPVDGGDGAQSSVVCALPVDPGEGEGKDRHGNEDDADDEWRVMVAVIRPGEALYLPALWAHAVVSETSGAGEGKGKGESGGVNAAANVWFVQRSASHAEAVRRAPAWAAGHFALGNDLSTRGEHAAAANALRRAVELRPAGTPGGGYFDAAHNLASAVAAAGGEAGAGAGAEEARRLYVVAAAAARNAEEEARCLCNGGIVASREGDLEGAAKLHGDAIALLLGENVDGAAPAVVTAAAGRAHRLLGNVRVRQQRLDEAETELRIALTFLDGAARALVHNSLGVIFEDTGRTAEAAAAYRTALGIDPTYSQASENMKLLKIKYGKEVETGAI